MGIPQELVYNGKSYWMMTGGTPMDWKPPYVTYVFLVKNGMLDYESLREVAVRTRTFIIFQTLNHNACRFFMVFGVPHQQWIKQNNLEIGRYPVVHLLTFLLRGCWIHVHTQPPFSTAGTQGSLLMGQLKETFPKLSRSFPYFWGSSVGVASTAWCIETTEDESPSCRCPAVPVTKPHIRWSTPYIYIYYTYNIVQLNFFNG